ncbi:ACP S-malonyltransferase [Streptomyces sp. NPDC059680]|uniref:ACP S-malonyltransferase n=1 Tax=Streptomyces sp. NPDC059680 TaxID=3346904 RepID=UPI00368B6C54
MFPGQGDFSLPALREAVRAHPVVRAAALKVFTEVDAALVDLDIPPLVPLLWAPVQECMQNAIPAGTEQAALYASCMTVHVALSESGLSPDGLAGVSFGELSALAAAGVFTVADGARLAVTLARVLPRNTGGMVWLGAGERDVIQLLAELGNDRLALGCVNGPEQSVVVGAVPSLMAVQKLAKRLGFASSRVKLPYYAHHPELAGVAAEFESAARAYAMGPAHLPVFSAAHGRAYSHGEDIPHMLAQVITKTAHVPRMIAAACSDGTSLLLEAGTGASVTQSAPNMFTGIRARAPLSDKNFPWHSPGRLLTTGGLFTGGLGPASQDHERGPAR